MVISDGHPGLVAAVEATFLGAAWQRCPDERRRDRSGGDLQQPAPDSGFALARRQAAMDLRG